MNKLPLLFFFCLSTVLSLCQVTVEEFDRHQKMREKVVENGEVHVVLNPRKNKISIAFSPNVFRDSITTNFDLDIDSMYRNKNLDDVLEIKIKTSDTSSLILHYRLHLTGNRVMVTWQGAFSTVYSGEGVVIKVRNKRYLKRVLGRIEEQG